MIVTRRRLLGIFGASLPMALSSTPGQAGRTDVPPILTTFPFPREGDAAVVVDTGNKLLHANLGGGRAIRYPVAVGREGEGWRGAAVVGRKAKWPAWTPTESMLKNQPGLSYTIDGGPGNPLGARALYLYRDGKDTLYRIHGACDPRLLGRSVSSGCIRMLDEHIVDLYERVAIGAKVIAL